MKKTKTEPPPPPPQRCLTKTEVDQAVNKANGAAWYSVMQAMLGDPPKPDHSMRSSAEPYAASNLHRHDTYGDEACICCQISARHPKPRVRIDEEGRFYRPSTTDMMQSELTIQLALESSDFLKELKALKAEFKASKKKGILSPQKD